MALQEKFTRPILNPHRNLRYVQALGLSKDIQTRIRGFLVEDESLQGKVDMLRRLSIIFRGKSQYAEAFFSLLGEDNLGILLSQVRIQIGEFIELGLLPTPTLWQGLLAGKVADLKAEQDNIRGGGFDKNNPLHIELEYSKWVMKGDQVNSSWKAFTELLGEKQNEIRNIVADNEEIRNFIEAEAKKGKVLVLFNSRYGTDYVGVFLQEDLVKNPNIVTTNISVRSTEYDSEEEFIKRKFHSDFSNSTLDYLDQEHDTVIVIDGTRFNDHQGKKKRFPAATTKIVWELIKNGEYNLRFWIPNTGEVPHSEVMLGWWCDPQEFPLSQGKKDLIVVRATGRSQGLFDDPEDCTFLSYTPTGVTVTPLARSKNRLNMEIGEEARN